MDHPKTHQEAWGSGKIFGASTACGYQLSDCNHPPALELQHHAQRNLTWEYVAGLYAGRTEFDSELQHQHMPFLLNTIALHLLDVPLR
jgi:hypothetical protein